MNPSTYIPIIVLFIILYFLLRSRRAIVAKKVIEKRKRNMEDRTEMVELAKKFIDKECVIYAFDSGHQFVGVVKEVNDGAILLETNGALEVINLDFVIRIREYPRKKNGKKKSVVLD